MGATAKPRRELLAEIEELRLRLEEAEAVLAAIRSGVVDALVVSAPEGEQIFTLRGADLPYRALVESMNEGAANLAEDGTILYGNSRLAAMLGVPLERLIGTPLAIYIDEADRNLFNTRLAGCAEVCDRVEITLTTGSGNRLPVLFSCCAICAEDCHGTGVILTDISARKQAEEQLREAELQVRMAAEREQAADAIKASLAEKEVLLKEIHHRVKNNLQVISSLISLQAEGSKDTAAREMLKDVIHRVRSMALIHEKLYQSHDLAQVDFAAYAQSLLGYLWRSHGDMAASIRMTLDMEPLSLSVDMAVPLGLVLNELAGNALKHAFRGRPDGEVKVSLKKSADGKIRLCLADDGLGLPADFDWLRAQTLGLRLVQMLAGQIDAEVDVASGAGTRFEIIFQEGVESRENPRVNAHDRH